MLTTREAAIALHVKPATLKQWRWSGRGPGYVKRGRQVFYEVEEIHRWLEEHTDRVPAGSSDGSPMSASTAGGHHRATASTTGAPGIVGAVRVTLD